MADDAHLHHFSYGLWTPLLAYGMSVVGALLGLMCTSRARASSDARRAAWLGLAALSIGGTGIWVMHFIAMLGFAVDGARIRYDVPLTLLSAFIAIVVVGMGLFAVGFGGARLVPLVSGGVVTGLGVASMHYTGMAAMRMPGHVGYDPFLVLLSIVIAVVAATAALWFTVRVRGTRATVGAALIMGVAVSGMHYTGMAAMEVTMDPHAAHLDEPSGAGAADFLVPLIVVVSLVATVLLVVVAMAPTEAELEDEARSLAERLAAPPTRPAPMVRPDLEPPARAPLIVPRRPPVEDAKLPREREDGEITDVTDAGTS